MIYVIKTLKFLLFISLFIACNKENKERKRKKPENYKISNVGIPEDNKKYVPLPEDLIGTWKLYAFENQQRPIFSFTRNSDHLNSMETIKFNKNKTAHISGKASGWDDYKDVTKYDDTITGV